MSQPMRAGNSAGIDGEALALFLRRRHPHGTAGYVAAATGIAEATIKDWLQQRCRPSTSHFLRLIAAAPYGLPLMEACWSDAPPSIRFAAESETLFHLRAERARLERRIAAMEGGAP